MEEKEVKTENRVEELERTIEQLKISYTKLFEAYQNAQIDNVFKRLDYLFKVVDNFTFFNKEFANNVIKEIEDLLTIKSEKTTQE